MFLSPWHWKDSNFCIQILDEVADSLMSGKQLVDYLVLNYLEKCGYDEVKQDFLQIVQAEHRGKLN